MPHVTYELLTTAHTGELVLRTLGSGERRGIPNGGPRQTPGDLVHQTRPHTNTSNQTVITGATGFVGGELLVKLLRDSGRSLICPVRADSQPAAEARGYNVLVDLVGADEAALHADRVTWLRADIEERQLGWSDAQWHRVAMNTHEIFHCAASVSFDLPLDQAHRINVAGTMHVFELAQAAAARHGVFERFHHVSTAYVAGIAKGRVSSNYLPQDKASLYRNTYERTKARAERFLRAEASARVPVSIHRPSIIAGNSRTGATTNWNVLYVPMKMVARGALPAFTSGGRSIVDAVAVDFLVEAMVMFSQLDSKPLESHHLTAGPTAFKVKDLIGATSDEAQFVDGFSPSQTKMFGPIGWRALTAAVSAVAKLPKRAARTRMGQARSKARIAQRCIDQCEVYLSYTNVNVIFDAARDHDVLRVVGIEMPSGPEYLSTIIDYALASNFGKKPVGAAADSVVTNASAKATV